MALPQPGGRRAKSGRGKDNYESPEMLASFDGIRDYLVSYSKDFSNVRSSDLAKLCADLQIFMEGNFGVTAKQQRRDWVMTRLPAKLFRDFRANGPMYTIMRAAYDHKKASQWRSFNLGLSKMDESITLFMAVENALREDKFLRWPRIFFDASVPQDRVAGLRAKAVVHAATVVDTREEATHIVILDPEIDSEGPPEGEKDPKDGNGDTCRILKTRGDKCMVHWWFHPDSYDEWIPAADLEGDAAAPDNQQLQDSASPYTVACRFVEDVDRFNEWGNELDYDSKARGKRGGSWASTQVKVRAPATPQQTKKPKEIGSAVKSKTKLNVDASPSRKKSSSGKEKRKHPSGSPGSSVTGGSSHKDSEVDSLAGSSSSGASSLNAGTRKRGESEDDDNQPTPGKKAKLSRGGDDAAGRSERTGAAERREAEIRARIKQMDGDAGSSTRKGRSNREAQAAAELKKLKLKRTAAVPELQTVMEVDVEGREGLEPVVGPSQDTERQDVQLMDFKSKDMRVIRSSGRSNGDGDKSSESEGEDEEQVEEDGDVSGSRKLAPGISQNLRPKRQIGEIVDSGDAGLLPDVDGAWPEKMTIDEPLQPAEAMPLPHMASELSDWFDDSTIHPLERRCLPEFFNGSCPFKTPEVYLAYRTYMIEQSRVSPREYLSYTDCRRRLAGDAGAILRVHEFLDNWGIINPQVPEEGRPPSAAARLASAPIPPSRPTTAKSELNAWTDEEVQALKEAVVELKDDWDAIAQRVGSKRSAADCLIKFLSLPLLKQGSGKEGPGPVIAGGFPLNELLTHVDSRVVKAAADAALKEVLRLQEEAENKGEDDKSSAMQVDGGRASDVDLNKAAGAGLLSLVGLQARVLAEKEEREVHRLLQDLLEIRLNRVEIKVQQLDEAEKLLEAERAALQLEREDLFLKKTQSAINATTL